MTIPRWALPPDYGDGDSGWGGQNDLAPYGPLRMAIREALVWQFNVRAAGSVVADGKTDDAPNLNAAIAVAAAAIASGKVKGAKLLLGSGKIHLKSAVTVSNTNNIRMVGDGRQATILEIDTTFTPGGQATSAVLGGALVFSQADLCELEEVTIQGANTSSVAANANVSGLQVIACRSFRLRTCEFAWLNGFGPEIMGSASLAPNASFYPTGDDLRMHDCAGGMHLQSVSGGGYGHQARFTNVNVGSNIGPIDGLLIEDCNDVMISVYEGPIHIKGGSAISISSFDSGTMASGSTIAIIIENSANTTATRVELATGETTQGTIGLQIGAGVGSVTLNGVQLANYSQYGLDLQGGTVAASGCIFNTNQATGTGCFDINSNSFHGNNVFSACIFTSAIGTGAGQVQAPVNIAQRDFTSWIGNTFVNGSPSTCFAGPNPPYWAVANRGYSPVGQVTVSVGASPYTVPAKGYYVTYYVTGGTVSSLAVNGVTLTGVTSGPVRVPPQATLVITYSVAPTVIGYGEG